MIPNTNLHKVVGFVSGIIVAYLADKGLTLDPEWVGTIVLGVSLFVGSIVAKWTNPTGANKSETREVLESVVKSETGTNNKAFDPDMR